MHEHPDYEGVTFTDDEMAVVNAVCDMHEGEGPDDVYVHTEELARVMGWDEDRVSLALHTLCAKAGLVGKIQPLGEGVVFRDPPLIVTFVVAMLLVVAFLVAVHVVP